MTLLLFLKPIYDEATILLYANPGADKKKRRRIRRVVRRLAKAAPLDEEDSLEAMQLYEEGWKEYLETIAREDEELMLLQALL